MRYINSLTSKDFTTITLDRPGPHNKPKVHEDPAVTLTSYPGAVRQLVVTGLGRDEPTVIITNDDDITTRALIQQYGRRMTIEQRLAEIIRSGAPRVWWRLDSPQMLWSGWPVVFHGTAAWRNHGLIIFPLLFIEHLSNCAVQLPRLVAGLRPVRPPTGGLGISSSGTRCAPRVPRAGQG